MPPFRLPHPWFPLPNSKILFSTVCDRNHTTPYWTQTRGDWSTKRSTGRRLVSSDLTSVSGANLGPVKTDTGVKGVNVSPLGVG